MNGLSDEYTAMHMYNNRGEVKQKIENHIISKARHQYQLSNDYQKDAKAIPLVPFCIIFTKSLKMAPLL